MGSRDDQFWAEFLGVEPADWATEGVLVRAHVKLAGYRGLWCFRRRDRVVVSVPAGWLVTLASKLEGCAPDTVFDAAFLAEQLGEDCERLIGPAFQGCLEVGRFRPCPSINVRFVCPGDAPAVDRFRVECGAEDWEHGGLDKTKHHVAAYFDEDRIAAMAGYRPQSEIVGDPCVLTHPEFRGKGYGANVVSAVVAAALAQGKLLLYQTLEANLGAVRIALKLGYDQYASHIAVRLKRESPSNP